MNSHISEIVLLSTKCDKCDKIYFTGSLVHYNAHNKKYICYNCFKLKCEIDKQCEIDYNIRVEFNVKCEW